MAFSSSFDPSSLEHKLLLAAYVGHFHSFKEVAVLLDRGKDCLLEAVEAVRDTNYEFGAFHMAAASGSLPLCQYLAESLLMDIGALDKLGQTPLSYAVSYGRSEVILYLLNRGANPDKPNVEGFTPLHYAVGGGNLEVIKVLLSSKSVAVNRLSTQGTALHIAATFGNENAIKLLLDNGANFQIKANDYTPLALALLVPSPKCVKILMEAGAAVEDIHPVPSTMLSANNGLSDCMRRLLEAGADLDLLYDVV